MRRMVCPDVIFAIVVYPRFKDSIQALFDLVEWGVMRVAFFSLFFIPLFLKQRRSIIAHDKRSAKTTTLLDFWEKSEQRQDHGACPLWPTTFHLVRRSPRQDRWCPQLCVHTFWCRNHGAPHSILLGCEIRIWDALQADAVFYLAVQFLIFYVNLHQHATGYANPDLESGGCLHSIFLSKWLQNNPLQDDTYNSWTIPKPLASVLVWSATCLLLGTCLVAPEKQTALASAIGGPFSLYAIATMGSRSYHLKKVRGNVRCFTLWAAACLSLIASQALVVLEEKFICSGPVALARTFHSVLTHALIVCLFYCVSESAIDLVKETQKSSKRD